VFGDATLCLHAYSGIGILDVKERYVLINTEVGEISGSHSDECEDDSSGMFNV
jgi:hypothetical protein